MTAWEVAQQSRRRKYNTVFLTYLDGGGSLVAKSIQSQYA